ncbi:MAG: TIGR04283 family arsenosugar biosynthesis glycosyltransferase [Deltaproteobacteria bacterium]|nr:TIGR04283 family arsenosugar biosynthesis glycosyltransferase [Deltaproteobacteria bacterium]
MKLVHLSIIIPVLNEGHIINQTLDHLYHLNFSGNFEVIVIDGSPDRNTINTIAHVDVKKDIASKGRGAQMNKGFAVAEGNILLFLHADTILSHDALDLILMAMRPKDIIGGAFKLGIKSNRMAFRIIEKAVNFRSRITRIPYGDQAIFIEKEFFHQVGRYKEIPLMEDVELMRRIKKAGGKIAIIPRQVQTSPRRWEKEGIIHCTLKNWTLITLYFLGISPKKLARFYK